MSGYLEYDDRRFIQTDATVNPGSSGGPMLSRTQAVVGITVAKVRAAGFEGAAFAVPVHEAVRHLGIQFTGD